MRHVVDLVVLGAVWFAVVVAPGPNFLASVSAATTRGRRHGIQVALGFAVGDAVWAASSVLGLAVLLARYGWLSEVVRFGGAAVLVVLGARSLLRSRHTNLPEAPDEPPPPRPRRPRPGRVLGRRSPRTDMPSASTEPPPPRSRRQRPGTILCWRSRRIGMPSAAPEPPRPRSRRRRSGTTLGRRSRRTDMPGGPSEPPRPRSRRRRSGILTGLLVDLGNPKAAVFFTSLFAALLPAAAPWWESAAAVVIVSAIAGGWYTVVACLFSTGRVAAAYRRLRRPLDALAGALFIGLGLRLASAG